MRIGLRVGLPRAFREEKIVGIVGSSTASAAVFKCLQAVAQETCERVGNVRHGYLSGDASYDMSNLLQ